MKDIEKMSEVHEQIKAHMYRRNEKGKESYCNLVIKLIKLLYESLKEDYKTTNTKIPDMFFHESISNVLALRDYPDHIMKDKKEDTILSTETTIGTIHRYIDTGQFKTFMTYYRGSNEHEKKGRWTEWSFHEKLNRFDWHPKYKDIVIEDYEKYIKRCDDEEKIKAYKEEIKYWKTINPGEYPSGQRS